MDLVEEEALTEALAQCKYENKKLKDEIDNLRRNSLSVEENVDMLSADLYKKESNLKKSEKQINSLIQTIKEKDDLLLEIDEKLRQVTDCKEKLHINLTAQKAQMSQQREIWRKREKELIDKYEKDILELKKCIGSLNEENASNVALLNDLYRQFKISEDEKGAIEERVELSLNEKYDRYSPIRRSPSNMFKGHSPHCTPPKQQNSDFSFHVDGNGNIFDEELNHINLREELFLAEIHEKENKIIYLEEKLEVSERTAIHRIRLTRKKIMEAIDMISVPGKNSGTDLESYISQLETVLAKLARELETWSEGQTGENNPLTEAHNSEALKEQVVNAQPVANRVVDSVSISTQTDKILLAKALEEFSPVQNVSEHKYNDLDMDLYRSYRKLSILPEEEDDDSLTRVPSIKNAINCKSFSAKLSNSQKTQSADDLLLCRKEIGKCVPPEKLVSSCANIILSGRGHTSDESVEPNEFFRGCSKPQIICDNKLSDTDTFKSELSSVYDCNEVHVESFDPAESLRQPHSFDSYLDPQQMQGPTLPRQASDPVPSKACDLPLTRRGSYLKRPRSTCRPLRLPCDDNDDKREERVSKVRFDLSNSDNSKSDDDNINRSKGPMTASNVRNYRMEKVSRFTVVRVDEEEFRRSIDEANAAENRKRPPLIHSIVYKKSALNELTAYEPNSSVLTSGSVASRASATGSPESPSYETATESSPVDSFDMNSYEGCYVIADIYPSKRRKQSDSSNYSAESQDSLDGNDILVKSIRLHANGEHITMKELDRDSSASSHLSVDLDIPYIDAEELPVIKPSPEIIKSTYVNGSFTNEPNGEVEEEGGGEEEEEEEEEKKAALEPKVNSSQHNESPISQSESSETFLTACSDVTPTAESPEAFLFPPKPVGLSKSPTVLKNLANFELFKTVSESLTGANQCKTGRISIRNEVMQEEEEDEETEDYVNEKGEGGDAEAKLKEYHEEEEEEEESTFLKFTSPDASDMSDTVTYVTVKSESSNFHLSSDCDSDTYVTIQSDKSTLERKFSDLSENSSSPYNTPPDTSSASFCTPPDTYSPILNRLVKHFGSGFEVEPPRSQAGRLSPRRNNHEQIRRDEGSDQCLPHPVDVIQNYGTPPSASPFASPSSSSPFKRKRASIFRDDSFPETESVTIYNIDDSNYPSERVSAVEKKELIMFDSPQLEFYETNDSIENLEEFLKTEEGLQESPDRFRRSSNPEGFTHEPICMIDGERKNSDFDEGQLQNSNLESPSGMGDARFFEKRNKRHPPLSRQNSTEDYNYLDPHDSCLNLSEEISSPSTTPDTSNKTVIFKNKPLTVSNTIDLEDDDFPISEAEIQINFNGSETEIMEIAIAEGSKAVERHDIYSCRSEPCIPSISTSSDSPTMVRLRKQSSSMTDEEPVVCSYISDGLEANLLPVPPEIIVSNLSSESENDSDGMGGILVDFASNASDRSDVHLSDLFSVSGQSDAAGSNSDPSDVLLSERSAEVHVTDPEVSTSVSPELSECSSDSDMWDRGPPVPASPDASVAAANASGVGEAPVDVPPNSRDSTGWNSDVVDLSDRSSPPRWNRSFEDLAYQFDSLNRLQQSTDLLKLLDIIVGTANFLTGTAEAYGFSKGQDPSAYTLKAKQMECNSLVRHHLRESGDVERTGSEKPPGENLIHKKPVRSTISPDHSTRFRHFNLTDTRNSTMPNTAEGTSSSVQPPVSLDASQDAAWNISPNKQHTLKPKSSLGSGNCMSAVDHLCRTRFQGENRLVGEILKWIKFFIYNSRFQFPQSLHQYASFFATWYIFALTLIIFTSGAFSGFNGFLNFEFLFSYSIMFGAISFLIIAMNFTLKWKPLKLVMFTLVGLYINSILFTYHSEGLLAVLERLGIQVEAQYRLGSPPI